MKNILSDINVNYEAEEELAALLDNLDNLRLTAWEYDYIMSVAEQEFISDKQMFIITKLYLKHIEGEGE